MTITGSIEYNFKGYEFVLTNISTCTYQKTTLYFENDYNEFEFKFDSLDDFLQKYKEQNMNLFKVFFNDNTIDFDSLDYDLEYNEVDDICSTYSLWKDYPVIDSIVDCESWSWSIQELVRDDFENEKTTGEFYWVIKTLNGYINYEESESRRDYILESEVPYIRVDSLSISKIRELYEKKELNVFIEYHEWGDNLTQSDKDYINLAVNYNSNKEYVKVV